MLLFGSSRNLLSSSLLCSADMCGVGGGGEAKKEAPWRFGGVFLRGFCTRVLHTGQVSGRTPAYVLSCTHSSILFYPTPIKKIDLSTVGIPSALALFLDFCGCNSNLTSLFHFRPNKKCTLIDLTLERRRCNIDGSQSTNTKSG
jgi:hypothetical protein